MKEKIIQWCRDNGVFVKHLTDYQTRLSNGNLQVASTNIVMDVYSEKFHIIRHPDSSMVQQRGTIPEQFELLLESVFSNTK